MVFGGLEGLFVVVKKLHHSSLVPSNKGKAMIHINRQSCFQIFANIARIKFIISLVTKTI